VAQLFEALLYKPEGRGFDSRWCQSHNPSGRTMALGLTELLTIILGIFRGGKGGRCIGVTTLSTSCANCLEIWEPSGPVHALIFSIPERFVT
jgi:hypothetical protein